MIDLTKDHPGLDDLARRSVVYADQAMPGRARQPVRVLEQYPARMTALFRLAPGQALPVERLKGGLEILVVEGEVEFDGVRLGKYGYARRPGSLPATVTATRAATLFVKRGHIPPEDLVETILEPRTPLWQVEPGSTVLTLPLHRHGDIAVALLRYPAGSSPAPRRPPGGEEILVLEGTLLDERSAYPRGSWIRNPPGSLSQPYSVEDCVVYSQTGHLPVV